MTLYLSRLKLRRDPSIDTLAGLIDPDGPQALDAHHRLLWTLFVDHPDRRRDFLWRADGKGRFYTLSHRPPNPDGAGLFEAAETKTFDPDLRTGDKLRFVLRANATRSLPSSNAGERGKRVDVVMHALKSEEDESEMGPRAGRREAAAQTAGREWLARQGETSGFRLVARSDGEPEVSVTSYHAIEIPGTQGRRQGRPRFGIMDVTGIIEIYEPDTFLDRMATGFGRAKAFGCGLMLIRRI